MNAAELRAGRLGAIALSFALLFAGAASAAPLGLTVGDVITSVEWDALMSNPPQGGFYDNSTGLFHSDGRVTSVDIQGPTTIGQSGVEFEFDLDFLSEFLDFSGAPVVLTNIALQTPGGSVSGPDVTIRENGNTILFGNFSSLVTASGQMNLASNNSEIVAIGRITITGGDAMLVNALGGAGIGQADILLAASVFDFSPSILTLVGGDGEIFNSNFGVSLSGTLTPLNSAPFVPEPSTALLLGGGLVGLVAVTRRARR